MSFRLTSSGLRLAARGIAVSGCAGLILVAVTALPGPTVAAPPPIPVSQITAGMTGYGLTVFAGSRIDTFSVRVLGVQPNARAQGSLVLVEVGGHGLEQTSIAQGMSGSPVYLDGRFAGALAFGWEGALAPIGGVTPADEMLAMPSVAAASPEPRTGGAWDARWLINGTTGTLGAALAEPGQDPPTTSAALKRSGALGAAVSQSGWPDALDLAAALLEPLGARDGGAAPAWIYRPAGAAAVAAGGGGAIPPEEVGTLRPGSACAVSLVGGDADLGAIGTVTWVDGDRVLMMGHPLLQRGAVNLPLATADIVTIMPSRRISFKMGSPGPVVGAVHHDLRAGLAGRLGAVAPVVPVAVDVTGSAPGTFRFTVAEDAQLTPLLVYWSFYNALLARGDDASRQSISWRLETAWRQPGQTSVRDLVLGGVASGPGGAGALASEIMAPLALLMDNPFGEVALASAAFTAEVRPGRGAATVAGLSGPRRVAAGTTSLPLTVELQEVDEQRRAVAVTVTLPASLPAGAYRVVAASAAEFFAFEAQRAPGRLQPERLSDLWELVATERSPSTLVVAVFSPERPVIVGGRELAAMPGSVSRVVGAGRHPGEQAMAQFVARQAHPTSFALTGNAVRTLEILPAPPAASEARRP